MKYQLEYDYELELYQVELINKKGESELSAPFRSTPEFAEEIAKNTIQSDEKLVDYKIKILRK